MKKLAIIIATILLSLHVSAQLPKHEIRAVWLTTIGGIDWPHSYNASQQKEELIRTLDELKAAGVNTVLLQTRVRGTTIYPSALEPWDGCMSGHPGKSPGYDPLQLCIDECHRRGMELHAWVVTIPVGKWNNLGCKQLRQKYPKLIRKIGDDGYMIPEQAETANYLARFCREIASRYDVDGIHLDYIRYPETWPKARKRGEGAERRANITRIVRAIYQAVKQEKRWVKLSCSPIGKYDDLLRYRSGGWNARTAMSQDVQQWLREGIMDQIYPMMYFRANQFFPFAIDWQEHAYGRSVAAGLGIYFLDPREGRWQLDDITRQMYVVRQLGLGHCYFRSKFFTDNVKGILRFAREFDAQPALVPPMTWEGKEAPTSPTLLRLHSGRLPRLQEGLGEVILTWTEARNTNDSPYLLYNVYASDSYPVDVTRAENIVAVRLRGSSIVVPEYPRRYYAVTACDRYGHESEPCQMKAPDDLTFWQTDDIQQTDGKLLRLPTKPSTLDADYLIVETLQGQQLVFLPYTGKYVSIAHLPDGIYAMRSLGKKGRNHRLAYFSIRRQKK